MDDHTRWVRAVLANADRALAGFMSAHGVRLLRLSIASVYLWFGALKLIDASPATELVVRTLFWLPPQAALKVIGSWEVLIGLGLFFAHPRLLRVTVCLLWLQIAGTFQIFFLLPNEAFQGGNPLLPTLEGQYAIKNIVLISAGLVIWGSVRQQPSPRATPEAQPVTQQSNVRGTGSPLNGTATTITS